MPVLAKHEDVQGERTNNSASLAELEKLVNLHLKLLDINGIGSRPNAKKCKV